MVTGLAELLRYSLASDRAETGRCSPTSCAIVDEYLELERCGSRSD